MLDSTPKFGVRTPRMSLESPPRGLLRFGTFEVDLRSRELRKQGVRIKLQEQPFLVLKALLGRPGEIVTREELRSQIWSADTFVDFDNSLNTSINKLREALGDSAESPRFIETVPRRGYRFIASVTPGPRKFAVLAAITATTVAVVAGGYFSFVWYPNHHPPSPPELKQWQLTTNSFENPVRTGSISSDGKYLVYSDPKKMYIKLIDTGEIRDVAQPEALQKEKTTWQIVCWFPDNIRFLVNAHPAGTGGEEWNSLSTSIWIVSVLGGPPRKLREGANAYSVSPMARSSPLERTAADLAIARFGSWTPTGSTRENCWKAIVRVASTRSSGPPMANESVTSGTMTTFLSSRSSAWFGKTVISARLVTVSPPISLHGRT